LGLSALVELESPSAAALRNAGGIARMTATAEIDSYCELLEESWNTGAPVAIEELLTRAPDSLHPELLPELVQVEAWWRMRRGDSVSPAEYADRFPQHSVSWSELVTPDESLISVRSRTIRSRLLQQVEALDWQAGDRIAEFQILNRLGEGAFSKVFLAQQTTLQRIVALKVTAFRTAEAAVLSNLDHPHIIRVFDERALPETGLRILYMQHAPGGSLKDLIALRGERAIAQVGGSLLQELVESRLAGHGETLGVHAPAAQLAGADWASVSCWIGACLADALDYSHPAIVHRDIKPSNVLLGRDGAPLLADYNLSCDARHVTADDSFGGTYAYMSPEQLQVFAGELPSAQITSKTDLFSLGVVLWELAAGRTPFPVSTDSSLMSMIDQRQRALVNPGLPPPLFGVIRDCLRPDPESRPDARRLAHELLLLRDPETSWLRRAERGWFTRACQRFPVVAMVLCGVLSNLLVTAINVVHNLTFVANDGFDVAQLRFHRHLILGFAYPLATIVLLRNSWPVLQFIRNRTDVATLRPDQRQKLLARCLSKSSVDWAAIFGVWSFCAFVFPILNDHSQGWVLPAKSYLAFISSQLLYGLTAASLTALAISRIDTSSFLPRLLMPGGQDDLRDEFARYGRRVDCLTLMLIFGPLFTFFRMAAYGHVEERLVLALSLFSIACLGVGIASWNRVRRNLSALKLMVTPTRELLQRPVHDVNVS